MNDQLLNNNDSENLASQISHQQDMLHQGNLALIIEKQEYNLFSLLNPKLYKDGNQWCCLYGEDIANGIVGFGDTPYKAILAWNTSWYETIPKTK